MFYGAIRNKDMMRILLKIITKNMEPCDVKKEMTLLFISITGDIF